MDIAMVAQLSAGMRGLQCVYNAVGRCSRISGSTHQPAFPAGLGSRPRRIPLRARPVDARTHVGRRTGADRLVHAYAGRGTPCRPFRGRYHPKFLKAQRAKWETAIRTVPKQVMPYLMLRHSTTNGFQDGIRQAALLGKAWGMSREWIVNPVMHTAYYFTGLQGLGAAERALRPFSTLGDELTCRVSTTA